MLVGSTCVQQFDENKTILKTQPTFFNILKDFAVQTVV